MLQWLVEKSDCMFVGLRDDYVSLTSSDLLYTVDTNIHHVEHWGSISENEREFGRAAQSRVKGLPERRGVLVLLEGSEVKDE